MIDWHAIILQPQWLARVERHALKRFGQQGLAEEASAYVLEKLSQNNWASCNQYTGKAKPETFLYTLVGNLLEEFARKRFGRPRPPQWLQREGELWVSLWKMVCLERQLVTVVVDKLGEQSNRSNEFIHGIIRTIKARLPWCGSSNREIPSSMVCSYHDNDNEEEIAHNSTTDDSLSHNSSTLEQQLEQSQLDDTLFLTAQLLALIDCPSNINEASFTETNKDENAKASPINTQQLEHFYQALNSEQALSQEERLLLKMVFQEGLKMNVIAKALNMPSYQPGRLLKGVFQRIEVAMKKTNIPVDDINQMLRMNN